MILVPSFPLPCGRMFQRVGSANWRIGKKGGTALQIHKFWIQVLEEIRMYHRKDGLLVKHGDDAISALRYGMMMLRYGRSNHGMWKMRQPWKAPELGIV